MGSRLVCSVPVGVSGVRYKKVLIRHAVMFILTCIISSMSCHAPLACSGSVSQLSLQPCDLISLTDSGCLGKDSLSPQCLSPQVYALCDKLIVAPFENALLSV